MGELSLIVTTDNPLTTGPDYIQVFIFLLPDQVPPFKHVIKCDINQQYL